jgi:Domain of unknown function (DUF4276)
VSVRIYVEGGFQGSTKNDCRKAFRLFLQKAIPPGSFSVIASGSRHDAFQDFREALKRHPADYVMLLVDSEEPVIGNTWQHLRDRQGDNWHRPAAAGDDQAHLMVQVMESWFLAHKEVLTHYYGQGFLAGSLPGQPNIELIAKQDVFKTLQYASRKTQKGEYRKTTHGFDLLELIDPKRVRAASHHAERLFAVLERETAT